MRINSKIKKESLFTIKNKLGLSRATLEFGLGLGLGWGKGWVGVGVGLGLVRLGLRLELGLYFGLGQIR